MEGGGSARKFFLIALFTLTGKSTRRGENLRKTRRAGAGKSLRIPMMEGHCAVAAFSFRPPQRAVGRLVKRFGRREFFLGGKKRPTGASGDFARTVGGRRLPERMSNPFHQGRSVLRRNPQNQQSEFVSAEPRHLITGPDRCGQLRPHRPQERVANRVPVLVIDQFEPVHIEHGYT